MYLPLQSASTAPAGTLSPVPTAIMRPSLITSVALANVVVASFTIVAFVKA